MPWSIAGAPFLSGTEPKGLYTSSVMCRFPLSGGTLAPDTMCTVAEQAKLLHRINRRSLFLTVQASIRCRCPALYLSSVLNFSEKHGMKQNRTVVRR